MKKRIVLLRIAIRGSLFLRRRSRRLFWRSCSRCGRFSSRSRSGRWREFARRFRRRRVHFKTAISRRRRRRRRRRFLRWRRQRWFRLFAQQLFAVFGAVRLTLHEHCLICWITGFRLIVRQDFIIIDFFRQNKLAHNRNANIQQTACK